jgi:hypothetical protein
LIDRFLVWVLLVGAWGGPAWLNSIAGDKNPFKVLPWDVQKIIEDEPDKGLVTPARARQVLERVERWGHTPATDPALSSLLFDPSGGPKPRLILHVGPRKTGSTALQLTLAKNAESLKTQGVFFPISNTSTHFTNVGGGGNFLGFYQQWDKRDLSTYRSSAMRFFKAMRIQAQHASCHTVLLSSECVFHEASQRQIATVLSAAKEHFELTTVAFMRELYSWALSVFSQEIRAGRAREFFCVRTCQEAFYAMRVLSNVAAVEPKLRICNYDVHRGHLLEEFLRLAKLPVDLDKLALKDYAGRRINPGFDLSLVNCYFLYLKHGCTHLFRKLRGYSRAYNPVRYYDPEIAASLYATYADDIAHLNKHYLPADEQLPTEPHCPEGYTTEWDHDYFEAEDIRHMLTVVPTNTPLHAELRALLKKCSSATPAVA